MQVPEDAQHDQVSRGKAVTLSIQCYQFDKLMRRKVNKKQCDTPDIEKFYE